MAILYRYIKIYYIWVYPQKVSAAADINGLYLKVEIDFSLFLFKVQSNLYIKYMFDSSNCHSSFIDVGEIAIYNKVKLQLMGFSLSLLIVS
ncbi:hypothetical protein JOC25_001491 [Solibacillus kalamii]|uniref:Uncharacterized protein n=1 Tax=Solibacillus kalamii TaxID=1748298 RepID=A0ABX3ZMF8_9BACL|nr:hypothetical protein [Solibacillus kalamii]OUZ40606.1 hypothetical protein CBM15_01700 [Solibacillus kalamii]